MIIWIIGLSGSGKTTIGNMLYQKIKKEHKNTVFLDGDSIRSVMGNDLGHSINDRKINADRICRLCQLLDSQDINVVCCILSIFHQSQDWNRRNYKKYFEVFIDVSRETLIKRDIKDIYKKTLNGEIKNVVGFDIKFIPPKKPNLIINNDKDLKNIKGLAKKIIDKLPKF